MNRFYPMAFLGRYSCDSPIFKKKVGILLPTVICNEHEQVFVRVLVATLCKLTRLVLNNLVKTSSS